MWVGAPRGCCGELGLGALGGTGEECPGMPPGANWELALGVLGRCSTERPGMLLEADWELLLGALGRLGSCGSRVLRDSAGSRHCELGLGALGGLGRCSAESQGMLPGSDWEPVLGALEGTGEMQHRSTRG